MTLELMLAKAISIAAQAFEGRTDKGGHPYILHCLRVMNGVEGFERKAIAVLHDVLEDCPEWSPKKFYEAGLSDRIVLGCVRMKHDKGTHSYEDYIKGISLDEDCTAIKLKDLEDNSNITRLKGLTKKDFDRIEKYHRWFVYLSNVNFKPVEA